MDINIGLFICHGKVCNKSKLNYQSYDWLIETNSFLIGNFILIL